MREKEERERQRKKERQIGMNKKEITQKKGGHSDISCSAGCVRMCVQQLSGRQEEQRMRE